MRSDVSPQFALLHELVITERTMMSPLQSVPISLVSDLLRGSRELLLTMSTLVGLNTKVGVEVI